MNASPLLAWEDRLTQLTLILLLGATTYGVFAGATVTMYYDTVPNMGGLEDNLGAPQLLLYLLAILISFAHLPLALVDLRRSFWKQALARVGAFIGPLVVFLGTDGLIAHALWWSPISDTDRFHLLHHSLLAGAPLTLGYGLWLRWVWKPASFATAGAPSLRVWLVSGIVLLWVVTGMGIFIGLVTPFIAGVAVLLGVFALPLLGRLGG
jgi:hypothetical protein